MPSQGLAPSQGRRLRWIAAGGFNMLEAQVQDLVEAVSRDIVLEYDVQATAVVVEENPQGVLSGLSHPAAPSSPSSPATPPPPPGRTAGLHEAWPSRGWRGRTAGGSGRVGAGRGVRPSSPRLDNALPSGGRGLGNQAADRPWQCQAEGWIELAQRSLVGELGPFCRGSPFVMGLSRTSG